MRYTDFLNIHEKQPFIVCGCGNSINNFNPDNRSVLFGVNDITRRFYTKYLLCVNDPNTFQYDRWDYVKTTTTDYVFSNLDLPIDSPEKLVNIKLGKMGGIDLNNPNIDYTRNSPYMAIIIAYQMGASKIGLIGVDFTPNHFFQKTGNHSLFKQTTGIQEEYRKLSEELIRRGIKIANLSVESVIPFGEKMTLEQFNSL